MFKMLQIKSVFRLFASWHQRIWNCNCDCNVCVVVSAREMHINYNKKKYAVQKMKSFIPILMMGKRAWMWRNSRNEQSKIELCKNPTNSLTTNYCYYCCCVNSHCFVGVWVFLLERSHHGHSKKKGWHSMLQYHGMPNVEWKMNGWVSSFNG